MTEVVFWTLISMLNWNAAGDDEAVVAPVVSELAKKSVEDIHEFDEILARLLYSIDTKNHAKNIGEYSYRDGEYFSVDYFLYSRCVVVANGKELYYKVLKSPAEFPEDIDYEPLLYIASAAFELKTGKEYTYVSKVSYETYFNVEGWK